MVFFINPQDGKTSPQVCDRPYRPDTVITTISISRHGTVRHCSNRSVDSSAAAARIATKGADGHGGTGEEVYGSTVLSARGVPRAGAPRPSAVAEGDRSED